MSNFFRKLSSRKLWIAICGIATGICMVLGIDATEIETVCGGIVSILSCIMYIYTEGKIDAERVKVAIEGAQEIVETIKEGE